ncbi:MAG: FkbM family methyltransferase [bacterium]|nr:FkbM family methyltransferase [Gammaproteobacteria bacterium]HIL96681.1 FkbM family methyltransferase [Pseudomonadales bacterium]
MQKFVQFIGKILQLIPAKYRRLHRAAVFSSHFMPQRYDYVKTKGGYFLYLNLSHAADIIRIWGLWEPDVTSFLTQYLVNGMTFVDVGAHRGTYTMLAASLVGSDGAVIAIEPYAEHQLCLQKGAKKNQFSNVHIVNAAAGDKEGTVKITSASPHIDEFGDLDVDLVSIDSLVERADLVKIDTDGNELQVILGMKKVLRAGCIVVIEYSSFDYQDWEGIYSEITRVLQSYGYDAFVLDFYGQKIPVDQFSGSKGDRHVLYERTGKTPAIVNRS